MRRWVSWASLEIRPIVEKLIRLYVKVDVSKVALEEGFNRDVTEIGHYGTGNVELTIRNEADFERAKPLIMSAYKAE